MLPATPCAVVNAAAKPRLLYLFEVVNGVVVAWSAVWVRKQTNRAAGDLFEALATILNFLLRSVRIEPRQDRMIHRVPADAETITSESGHLR